MIVDRIAKALLWAYMVYCVVVLSVTWYTDMPPLLYAEHGVYTRSSHEGWFDYAVYERGGPTGPARFDVTSGGRSFSCASTTAQNWGRFDCTRKP